MSILRDNLAIILAAATLGGVFVNSVYAAESSFSDNYIGYRYGTAFREPGVANGADIQKNIVNFTHFNTDPLGSNFFTVDALFSHANNPDEDNTRGAREVYAIYRRDWSLSKITGRDFSGLGLIRDVALHMGGDMNTKDDAFAPRKKLLVIGPELQFALPSGTFNVAFDYSKEWNHNGIVHKDVTFDPAFEVETVWGFPFRPKGHDGFDAPTKGEILTRPELLLDVGELFGKKNFLELGVGYEYWLNKFGNDHTQVPGSLAKTTMLIAKVHF